MLNLTELRTFSAAAETENFSEAARRLGITQPSVSMQIRSLEESLGAQLFALSHSQYSRSFNLDSFKGWIFVLVPKIYPEP